MMICLNIPHLFSRPHICTLANRSGMNVTVDEREYDFETNISDSQLNISCRNDFTHVNGYCVPDCEVFRADPLIPSIFKNICEIIAGISGIVSFSIAVLISLKERKRLLVFILKLTFSISSKSLYCFFLLSVELSFRHFLHYSFSVTLDWQVTSQTACVHVGYVFWFMMKHRLSIVISMLYICLVRYTQKEFIMIH